MNSSFTLFRVRGIPIGANWSWLFVAAFFTWSLTDTFSATYRGHDPSMYVAMAFVTVVLFFGSLILHELGHAFRALKEGMEIEGITLWLFGGVAKFKGMFPTAGAEFRIAIAGPVITAVISAVLFALTAALHTAHAPAAAIGVPFYLAQINLILLGFNLLPALPLDGGRVYRAWLWQRTQNFSEATTRAARTARGISTAMIAIGALLFLRTGSTGLWWIFIGWFLLQASRSEVAYARVRQALGGLRAGDLMTRNVETIGGDTSLAAFFDDVVHLRGHSAYPVVDDGRFVGLLPLQRAAEVPMTERFGRVARDVMVPRSEVPTTYPDADISEVIPLLQSNGGRVIVMENDDIAGILSPSDVTRAVELGQMRNNAIAHEGPPPPRRTSKWGWVVAIFGALLVASYLYYPPFVVLAPGASFDVAKDIQISGTKATKVNGGFYLTSVSVYQPNTLRFVGALLTGKEIANLSAVVPKGVDQDKFFKDQRAEFDESRDIAAAAAARAAGLEVTIKGSGARIMQIVPKSPASKVLRRRDVVVAVDGKPVRTSQDLSTAIRAKPSGSTLRLTVERGGKKSDVSVTTKEGLIEGKAPAIGVLLDTRNFDMKLPFTIKFKKRDIGGPSAGSTYAMAIYDMLSTKDIANGRKIAGTGTITIDGQIGEIGGIEEKAIAAKGAGATLFVVPKSEAKDAGGTHLKVIGVTTLDEAVKALEA